MSSKTQVFNNDWSCSWKEKNVNKNNYEGLSTGNYNQNTTIL